MGGGDRDRQNRPREEHGRRGEDEPRRGGEDDARADRAGEKKVRTGCGTALCALTFLLDDRQVTSTSRDPVYLLCVLSAATKLPLEQPAF